MDASAEDRIRRSPSIGSSTAAPVPSGSARGGKRKLSTAAFGSAPNMAPQPPSSPITSEHASEDGIHQNASQVASTLRTTIDNSDASARPVATNSKATNSKATNSKATNSKTTNSKTTNSKADASCSGSSSLQDATSHTQFHDWQEQRRCHSILVEYDYVQPIEDRRDPRSSNAHLFMPLSSSSQQPQCIVTSDINEATSHSHLQPPPIAIHPRDEQQSAASTTTFEHSTIPSVHRSTPLQSTSVSPSPERAISPSPCLSDFGYQLPSTHPSPCFASSIPPPNISTPPKQLINHASDSLSLSNEPHPAQHSNTSDASTSALSASASAPPWLPTSSLSNQASITCAQSAQPTTPSHKVFHLQPVPTAKRRKLQDASTLTTTEMPFSTMDEARRSSDAGIPFHKTHSQSCTTATQTRQGIMANAAVQAFSSKADTHHTAMQVEAVKDAAPLPTLPALSSSHRTNLVVSHRISRVGPSTASSASIDTRSAAADASFFASKAPPAALKPLASSSRRPRFIRAKSLPNLRAKATLDITAPSLHRLILPTHWPTCHSRQRRQGHNASTKGSNARLSKSFAFNLARYPTASGSSRSRSIFTPTLHPPITRHTLRELDLFEILKNPQLRHDVVFDPNVQFRPNFDGERGRRKREAGDRYWTAVMREIETGCTCTAFSHGQLLPCTCKPKHPSSTAAAKQDLPTPSANGAAPSSASSRIPSRIPLLVQELRTICLSILPSNYPADAVLVESEEAITASADEQKANGDATESSWTDRKASTCSASTGSTSWATRHHRLIAQTLDPHLISQELQHGVLDVAALITFMGSILKLHCAPMRDEAIEKMVEVVCVDGNIGKGLRLCFEILELMKLDIANHQLRSARPFLVETAVDFEIRWFKEQIEQGKMSLDKTTAWIQQALATCPCSNSGVTSRSEAVVKAFNSGMLQLILDVPGSLPVLSPVATPLASPSSCSLNNTFAAHYPETFQLDAYRMMTFHNDVSDLTIVYMLVLLFRQLCSTRLDDAGPLAASVGSIAQKQLKSIKGEIWCLVNDANLCLSSSGSLPCTPTAAGNSRVDGKLFLGSAGGFAKLDHPRWRRAMQNVLLQVAARASAAQQVARSGASDPSNVKVAAPSAATQKLLNSWMDTNLRSGSTLHKICQRRLSDVVLGMLNEKVRNALQPCSCSPSSVASTEVADRLKRVQLEHDSIAPAKRIKSDSNRASTCTTSSERATAAAANASGTTTLDTSLTRAGLESFAAEIRLLSDRIGKVATLHLRVFRNLYEGIQVARSKGST
ncbi:hypothetical protein NDA18_004673 [Ustilago nuda]|nr:hypothetical protein NDA18_004673 [Ustilago nuda]